MVEVSVSQSCGFVQATSILENISDNGGEHTGNYHDTWRDQVTLSDVPECENLEGSLLRTCKLDYAYQACDNDYVGDQIKWCKTHVRNRV